MNKKILLVFMIFYIYYMFIIFKTKYSIHHPLEYIYNNKFGDFFKHPINSGNYESKICPFGKKAIYILVLYLIIRVFYPINKKIKLIILIIIFILSLMNFNALLYLIPYFIFEIYYLTKK